MKREKSSRRIKTKRLFGMISILVINLQMVIAQVPGLNGTAMAKPGEMKWGRQEWQGSYQSQLMAQTIQQSVQSQTAPDTRRLPVGETVERQLKGDEIHVYLVELRHGQVLQINVQEKGIDVAVALTRKADQPPLARANFGFGYDRETLTAIIEEAGEYMILVASPRAESTGGYELVAQIKEAATNTDRERIKAEHLMAEGLAARNKRSAEGMREAIAKWEETAPLWKKLGEKYWEGYVRGFLGSVYADSGEKQKAINNFTLALPLLRDTGDRAGEATTLYSIGLAYDDLGEKQRAIDYYELALPLFKATGDMYSQAATLLGIGVVYDALGEKQKALDYYEKQALPLFHALGDKGGEATVLNNIGSVYEDLGEKQKALDYYKEQALPLRRAARDKRGEAVTLNNIGSVYAELAEWQKAIDNFNLSLPLFRETGDRGGESSTLNNIGYIYSAQGEKQKALEQYNLSLSLSKAIHDRGGEALTLSNIGAVYEKSGEKQEALDYYDQALPLFRAVGDKSGEAATLSNLANVWESRGNTRMAIFYGKQAVNQFQQLRGATQGIDNESQKAFIRSARDIYQRLAELLIDEGRLEQAVEVLDFFQDQRFFDFGHSFDAPINQTALSPREHRFAERYDIEIQKVAQISTQIEDLRLTIDNQRLSEQEATKLTQLEAAYKTAFSNFLAVLSDATKEFALTRDELDSPPVKKVRSFQEALQTISRETKQATVALYTLIGRTNFRLLLVSPDGSIKPFASPIKANDMDNKIWQFYALLQSGSYDPAKLGKELYEIILKPAEAELRKNKVRTLLWSLNGTLRYIPMAALWDGEKYLIEQYQSVVFTRAEIQRMLHPVSRDWTGTGFGSSLEHKVDLLGDGNIIHFPALRSVTGELMAIFKTEPASKNGILMGQVFADKQFTKANFYQALQARRPVVHISSHFLFRPGNDTLSFLVLGDDTALSLKEMKKQKQLFAGVELLTLSACETAVTRSDSYDKEIDGFAELAQRLGASSVIATLWQVKEGSTAQLMAGFYKSLQAKELNKAEALRDSQLSLLYGKHPAVSDSARTRDGTSGKGSTSLEDIVVENKYRIPFRPVKNRPFAHPYYWSPFILFGNWK